jgi:hypothetical protein
MKIDSWSLVAMIGFGLIALASSGCGKPSVGAGPQTSAENPVSRTVSHEGGEEESASTENDEFAFPPDNEGKLLLETLRPSGKSPGRLPSEAVKPRRLVAAPVLEKPQLSPPALPVEWNSFRSETDGLAERNKFRSTREALRPRLLPEEPPFSRQRIVLAEPEVIKLPAGPRVRLPSPDVNQPIPLPILAQPVRNRVPLNDPTLDVSLSAALAETVPGRTSPAPFLRLTLPDPFENRKAVRLRKTPEEEGISFSVLPGPKP